MTKSLKFKYKSIEGEKKPTLLNKSFVEKANSKVKCMQCETKAKSGYM